MSLKTRLTKLEQSNEKPVDVAAILNAARNRCARGEAHPHTPMTEEVKAQLQRSPGGRRLLDARNRVGG